MLKVQNLHKKYAGEHFAAVADISFELADCEVLAIVGKSGSGKSTLLRMLAGLMKPDKGNIEFNGEALKNPEEQLIAGHSQIKMVFQDFQVKPNMTVAENVRYKLLHFNKAYQEERSQELLTLCGLHALANKMPHELSGGQQQRLSLARALADDPKLLLMDEPFSNLDPIIKEDLLMELTDIVKKEELSLILVSHDTKDALLIADRIAYIDNGQILQVDTPERLYNQPRNLAIAQFFGRVNVLSKSDGSPLYVRAEHIEMDGSENKLRARLVSCTFMGNCYLCRAITDKDQSVIFYATKYLHSGQEIDLGVFTCFELHFSEG